MIHTNDDPHGITKICPSCLKEYTIICLRISKISKMATIIFKWYDAIVHDYRFYKRAKCLRIYKIITNDIANDKAKDRTKDGCFTIDMFKY